MLRGIAGWLLLIGVLYIPWHDGGVAPASTPILSGLVLLAVVLWLVGEALERKRPRIPYACFACAVLLLFQGWWMTGNATRRYDAVTHSFFPVDPLWRTLPGSWDATSSQAAVLNAGCMLMAMLIACDLSRYPKWRRRFAVAIVVAGTLIAVAGVLRSSGTDPMVAMLGARHGTSFATFGYHGNAGSYINLCYPLAVALLLAVVQRTRLRWRRVLAAIPVLLLASGAITNVSRAAQAITVLLTVGLAAWAIWLKRAAPGDAPVTRKAWHIALPVAALIFMVAGVAVTNLNRWSRLPGQLHSKNDRLIMWQVCGYWLGDAGPLGYGPGTYKLIYPTTPVALLRELYPRWIVHTYTPGEPIDVWEYVYNDYLQYAFEWGWIGALLWFVLLFGGVGLAARASLLTSNRFGDRAIAGGVFFALGGILGHALVDYPLEVLSLQFYAGILLGLGWGSRYWGRDAAPEPVVVTVTRVDSALEHAKYN
jgi:hypothetical protein